MTDTDQMIGEQKELSYSSDESLLEETDSTQSASSMVVKPRKRIVVKAARSARETSVSKNTDTLFDDAEESRTKPTRKRSSVKASKTTSHKAEVSDDSLAQESTTEPVNQERAGQELVINELTKMRMNNLRELAISYGIDQETLLLMKQR